MSSRDLVDTHEYMFEAHRAAQEKAARLAADDAQGKQEGQPEPSGPFPTRESVSVDQRQARSAESETEKILPRSV